MKTTDTENKVRHSKTPLYSLTHHIFVLTEEWIRKKADKAQWDKKVRAVFDSPCLL